MSIDEQLYLKSMAAVRHDAEAIMRRQLIAEAELSKQEAQKTVYELKLHQIELELQTEALLKAQKRLRDSRDEYIYLYDHAPVGYLTINSDGLILRANLKAAELLGCKRPELLFSPLASFVSDLSVADYHLHERAVKKTRETKSCELTFKKKDAPDFVAQLDSNSELNEMGAFEKWNTTINDISLRKQAEAAINQIQKIESLSLMASGLTHDFNNFLAAIMSNAAVALKKLPEESSVERNLKNITLAAKKSADIAHQMLTFAGRNSHNYALLDLNKAIEQNIRLLQSGVDSHITVEVNLEDNLPMIKADKTQLSQMIINLTLNALNALGLNIGLIKIETKLVKVETTDEILRQYTGENVPAGKYVALSIYDNGEGIEAENLAKIFDPFYSTNEAGSGLGLASVLGVMRGHKGAVFVESEVYSFTRISLWFPLA